MTKPRIRIAGVLRIAALASLSVPTILAGSARAQTYTFSSLYSFDGISGANPTSGVTIDSTGELYGTATGGGEDNHGEVFVIGAGGNSPYIQADFNQDGSNGVDPNGVTVQPDGGVYGGNIYGTTTFGGSDPLGGTVFAIASATGPITTIASFTGANGSGPVGLLTVTSDSSIIGATRGGGANDDGTVFGIAGSTDIGSSGSIPPANSTVTTLATFDGANGASPTGVLLGANGNLYGTTLLGGANDDGTVFEIAAGTHTIISLASFSSLTGTTPSALTMDQYGNLFGTTATGGADSDGTVFEVVAGSDKITTIASFDGANGADPGSAALTIDAHGNLYGTTQSGGSSNDGTVFKIAAGTTSIISLASFDGSNGKDPLNSSVAVDSNGNLYGTTYSGGTNNDGTVFKLAYAAPTSVTWNGAGGDNNWSTSGNWIGNVAPAPTSNLSVTLDGNNRLSPNLEQPYSVYSLNFASTAGAFTVTGGQLTIGDGGITQNSSNLETIATSGIVLASGQTWRSTGGALSVSAPISGGGSLDLEPAGTITLTGNNSYSGGTIIGGAGTVSVGDGVSQSSSLGSGNVQVGNLSRLDYTVNSSAGNATISVTGSGVVAFQNSASAGNSTINLNTDGTGSSLGGDALEFSGTATAANATINSKGGGFIKFADNSTAANATILTAGTIEIDGAASLGNANITLVDSPASLIFLTSTACAAGAKIFNDSGADGAIDISQATADVSIGSLSSTASVYLGGHTLTLGALGLNDTIIGTVFDNPSIGLVGGITKVGSGTLTLSGANDYSGVTTVNAGTLTISGAGKYVLALSNAAGATLNVQAGTFFDVQALNGGVTNISGGTVSFVDSSNGGLVNITGGNIGQVEDGDPSMIDIYGGQFSGSIINDDPTQSIVDIFGSNFSLTDPTINGNFVDWDLTGTLSDGETLNTQYAESGNDTSLAQGLTFNGAASAPEPSALALLVPIAIPAILAARRRKKMRS